MKYKRIHLCVYVCVWRGREVKRWERVKMADGEGDEKRAGKGEECRHTDYKGQEENYGRKENG